MLRSFIAGHSLSCCFASRCCQPSSIDELWYCSMNHFKGDTISSVTVDGAIMNNYYPIESGKTKRFLFMQSNYHVWNNHTREYTYMHMHAVVSLTWKLQLSNSYSLNYLEWPCSVPNSHSISLELNEDGAHGNLCVCTYKLKVTMERNY